MRIEDDTITMDRALEMILRCHSGCFHKCWGGKGNTEAESEESLQTSMLRFGVSDRCEQLKMALRTGR